MNATRLLRRLTRRCVACGHRFDEHTWQPYSTRPCGKCPCENWSR